MWIPGIGIILTTTFYFLCLKLRGSWYRVTFGILISVLFCFLGTINFQKTKESDDLKKGYVKACKETQNRILRVKTSPVLINSSYRSEVEWIIQGQEPIGGVVYFKNAVQLPIPGNLIGTNDRIRPFTKPTNPGQFDYANYAHSNDWYFSTYINHWVRVEADDTPSITKYFIGVREKLLSILSLYIHGEEYAVSSALVFGDKSSLSPELKKAYGGGGAMHVLAVSGLHVGLVYLFLRYLFGFMDKSQRSKTFKTLLIIALIFVYAGLTGFSPSVTRAAIMFSLIAIGGVLKRSSSIYNIIFVSAFGMLLFDPRLLFSVSFQLSYIAVIGIVYLYPKLFLLWNPKTWIGYNLWSLICLSLSAQLSTFPLALYYFELFPTWFLITNIVVVPSAMIELGGGFLLIVAHFIHLGDWVGYLYGGFIWTINQLVIYIDQLPPGPINAGLTGLQLPLVYLYLITSFLLLEYPKKQLLWFSLSLLLLLVGSVAIIEIETQQQKGIIIYDSKNLMVEVYSGRKAVVYADTTSTGFAKNCEYLLNASFQHRKIDVVNVRCIYFDSLANVNFNYKDQKLRILNGNEELANSAINSTNDNYWYLKGQGFYHLPIAN